MGFYSLEDGNFNTYFPWTFAEAFCVETLTGTLDFAEAIPLLREGELSLTSPFRPGGMEFLKSLSVNNSEL